MIREIPYPRKHLEDLKRLGPLLIESMERDGLPIETGSIKLGRLDPKLDVAYFFFGWVSEANDIIGNLNLTIGDLRSLPRVHATLGGSPWVRYQLLVRTYFHEFYRFRELQNTALAAAVKRGYAARSELKVARRAFHDAVEEAIELRNSIVHASLTWKGQEHFDLNLASIFYNRGQTLICKDTGKEFAVDDALSRACEEMADALVYEGRKAAILVRAFVKDTVAAASEV